MEEVLGINIDDSNQVVIEVYDVNKYYDHVVVAKQLTTTGNGFCTLQFNDRWNEKPKDIISNGWKIASRVLVPYNWSGSTCYPHITDPTGSLRQVYADHYSKTIFKGLSFVADVKAVFDMMSKYSKYQHWSEYDVECAVREKDNIILELQRRVFELEARLDGLNISMEGSKN